MKIKVVLTNEATGATVFERVVDPDEFIPNDDQSETFDSGQRALMLCAPQMCPWDCDHCRD